MYLLNLPTLCVCSTRHNFMVPAQTELSATCSQTNWGRILHLVTQGSPAQSTAPDFTHQQPNPMKSKWLCKCGTVFCSTELTPWQTCACTWEIFLKKKKKINNIQDSSAVNISVKIFFKCPYKKNENYCYKFFWSSLDIRREAVRGWTLAEAATEIS